MTVDNSNLFQNEITESSSGFTESLESDFVDQMEKEDQLALKKKIFGEIMTGIRRHEEKAKNKTRILHHTKIAASVLLILSLHIGIWQSLKLKEQKYQTGANETLKIELPDGSKALLNSNSILTYSYTWVSGFERKVELNGEAYFDIAKDAESKRFVINEGEVMEVEVLGTEFNFKHQPPVYKLTLIEGSVKLGYQSEGGNSNRMVVPGETIKLNVENHRIESKTIDEPQRLLAWQDRKLRMQNESLEEVLSIVTELYDLELLDQKTPPTSQLISGSLPLTDNPNEVIANIEALFATKIDFNQNSIRVK
ncbi:FecR family protein [Algoriphagus antarcticus]|uniref:FecR family protein n=1 Tax=Algoriphagus antarcticus TaxID=238540 RepID=A0A3E0D7H6_9BACT|nr:FecR domain-containing protein [Algoriphagus antarcticus]REG78443.1 FecR family protein [Algoriphagus antarcticus]